MRGAIFGLTQFSRQNLNFAAFQKTNRKTGSQPTSLEMMNNNGYYPIVREGLYNTFDVTRQYMQVGRD